MFNLMERKGIVRNVKYYGIVVDLLGRVGRFCEVYDIINLMFFVFDIVFW